MIRKTTTILSTIFMATILLTFSTAQFANADTVLHIPGHAGDPSISTELSGLGMADVLSSETTQTTFFVPGSGTTTVKFTFEANGGAFVGSFGFYDVSTVTANPVTQKALYTIQALGGATEVFNDAVVNPGVTASFNLAAATELGFFLIPDASLATYLGNPGLFQVNGGADDSPLFSVSDANPGNFDQLFSFADNGNTLFGWEDLTRTDLSKLQPSDNDFNDLVFSVDAILPPTDPCLNLGGDTDGDGVCDDIDCCPNISDPNQVKSDGDTHGDACDNCSTVDNEDQANNDNDSLGDACDNCPDHDNEDQADVNTNGIGDVCDFCTPDVMDLIAGQTIDAGDVTIINDGTTLFVTIETQDGWSLTESHLDFGDLIDGFPTNKKGNPKVGHFDFQESHALGTTEFTYEFLLADLGIDPLAEETIPIAVHAVVVQVEADEIVAEESAWKQGERFVDKGNWAMFSEYTIQNCLIIL